MKREKTFRARRLGIEFPDMKGFSTRNLKYMRAFGEAWTDRPFVQQVVAQLPWGQNVRLPDRIAPKYAPFWRDRFLANNPDLLSG